MSERQLKKAAYPFVMIPLEFIKHLTSAEFKLYAEIHRMAYGHDKGCYESLETLANKTGLSVGTVKRAGKGLIKKNVVGCIKQHRKPTTYYLVTDPQEWNLEDQNDPQGKEVCRSKRSATEIKIDCNIDQNDPPSRSNDLDLRSRKKEKDKKEKVIPFQPTKRSPLDDCKDVSEFIFHAQGLHMAWPQIRSELALRRLIPGYRNHWINGKGIKPEFVEWYRQRLSVSGYYKENIQREATKGEAINSILTKEQKCEIEQLITLWEDCEESKPQVNYETKLNEIGIYEIPRELHTFDPNYYHIQQLTPAEQKDLYDRAMAVIEKRQGEKIHA